MTIRRQGANDGWRQWAGLALLLWAGHLPAATVSTPMEVSAQLPADTNGAGRTLDKALTGADGSTADRKLDMALDLQRADLAARSRPGTDPAAVARSAAVPQPGQPATPALALPSPGAGNGMPSALSLGGLSSDAAGLATPRSSARGDVDPRLNSVQGNASPGGGPPGLADLSAARRLAVALRDFLLAWRGWLLGGVALALVAAGLAQLVRKGARHRTGQGAIAQAAQRGGRHSSDHTRDHTRDHTSSRSGSRSNNRRN